MHLLMLAGTKYLVLLNKFYLLKEQTGNGFIDAQHLRSSTNNLEACIFQIIVFVILHNLNNFVA